MKTRQPEYGSREITQLVVFSLVVALGPLLLYPRTLGFELHLGMGLLFLLEAIYFSIVFSILNSGSGLGATVVGTLVAFGYRIALAAFFGLMIYLPGAESFSDGFWLGINGYWPAHLTFAITSPFVTLSFVQWLVDSLDTGDSTSRPSKGKAPRSERTAHSPIERPGMHSSTPGLKPAHSSSYQSPLSSFDVQEQSSANAAEFAFGADESRSAHASANGFERAVRYLAEDGSVRVASIVDPEGLELASFSRMGFVSSAWSPLALTLFENNSRVFSRHGCNTPNHIDLVYNDCKIDGRAVGPFYLVVVSERREDDLLGVRLNQACEMMHKFIAARYNPEVIAGLEERHV